MPYNMEQDFSSETTISGIFKGLLYLKGLLLSADK